MLTISTSLSETELDRRAFEAAFILEFGRDLAPLLQRDGNGGYLLPEGKHFFNRWKQMAAEGVRLHVEAVALRNHSA